MINPSSETKQRYKELCEDERSIPLMMQHWWLETVCPGQWEVFLAEEKGQLVGALPYHFRKKLGLQFIIQPQRTQYGGLWIKRNEAAACDGERLAREKRIFGKLIDQLEKQKPDYIEQCLHHSITNWLPYYWRGYTQTTRYTYVIESIGNHEKCLSRFSPSKQRQVRKAEGKFTLDLDLTPDEFYTSHKQALHDNRNQEIEYSYEFFLRLWKTATARKQGQILALRDSGGKVHVAHFIVWDKASAYDLLYFIHPDYASSGASTLIVAEMLKWLINKTKAFDFEGSMNEGIENSYRQFGTTQKPYFQLCKSFNPLAHLLIGLKKKTQK